MKSTTPFPPNPYSYIDALRTICNDYHKRIRQVEESKYDIEYKVATKDLEASIPYTHTHTHLICIHALSLPHYPFRIHFAL